MSGVEFRVGDVLARLAEIPDGSIDLLVTSPPFLSLRSYLPADHPDKAKEIGSEASPAGFLSTLLALSAEWRRVLAPHGSLCVELGDTFSGSGGAGGDYGPAGLRDGQERFSGSARAARRDAAWPLDKSLAMIPTLFPACLAYGRNLLTGDESPAGRWRIRNLLVWARPNPPVGALGDKFRPATSYVTVACTGRQRWFDLDAVRSPSKKGLTELTGPKYQSRKGPNNDRGDLGASDFGCDPAGAPPLDWHDDLEDGSPNGHRLWVMPTQAYKGAHYACFPMELPRRLIEAMCPREVCTQCGTPRRRLVEVGYEAHGLRQIEGKGVRGGAGANGEHAQHMAHGRATKTSETLGWSDCGCGAPWRSGVVLDPFGGSGTTGAAAQDLGRDCILIDLDERNAELARERIGMFLSVDTGTPEPAERPWVDVPLDFGAAS